jgi:hypothetical protein
MATSEVLATSKIERAAGREGTQDTVHNGIVLEATGTTRLRLCYPNLQSGKKY